MAPALTEPATNQPAAFTALDERYEQLPVEHIVPSKTNPRTRFDDAYLAQLASSIIEKGVIEPIVVRPLVVAPRGKGAGPFFEIVAGECRWRATKRTGRTHLPAVIRTYSDLQVLEVQLIENIHRRDLTPLEQARGYQALIASDPKKHTAASIATRLGMSEAWVWDRLKLKDLIPEAQALLERGKMAVGHAILVSRQTPANQQRLINPSNELLFVPLEHGLEFDGQDDPPEKPDKYDDVKACSVRELEAAIAQHIRFDVAHAAKAAPLVFEETATRVSEAEAKGGRDKKVIAITFAHGPSDDAKDPSERTYGRMSWKRADGTKKTTPINSWSKSMKDSPTCEHSVLGVVVAGDEHYGETFQVCVSRDKCKVHFGPEIAAREKHQKAGKTVGSGKTASAEQARLAREAREAEKRKEAEARWEYFSKALTKAVHAAADKTAAKLPGGLYAKVLSFHRLPASTKPADLAKALLLDAIKTEFDRHAWRGDEPRLVKWARALGVDVRACEPKKVAAPAKAKKAS
jgi:ParB/RepB/Spo0J family partition protein